MTDTSRKPAESEEVVAGLLRPFEIPWMARHDFLKAHGYLLRPRYRPGWTPSWPKSERYPGFYYEDGLRPLHSKRLDAERISDGQPVFLKLAPKTSPEIEIGKLLASPELRDDPRNHCAPLLDVLDDPFDPDGVIIILPLLRPIDSLPPSTMGELVPLLEQTLEALVFLHEHEIAHRDCALDNIMMDGRALHPEGWHPQAFLRSVTNAKRLPSRAIREVEKMLYYLIDFGLATHGQSLTVGFDGQERAPELSGSVPYDPYKLDVYVLGMMYRRFFRMFYKPTEIGPLQSLIDHMTNQDPAFRPTAREAYAAFKNALGQISELELSRRLEPREPESFTERLWNDIDHYLWTRWTSHWTTKRTAGPLM